MNTDLEWILKRLNNILTGGKTQEEKLQTITDLVTQCADEISLQFN